MNKFEVTCPSCGNHFEPIDISSRVESELKIKENQIRLSAIKVAEDKFKLELLDKDNELKEKNQALLVSQKAELDLRQKSRLFEEEKRQFELKVQRTVEELVSKEKELFLSKASEEYNLKLSKKEEEYRLKELEKDKQIKDIKIQLDAANRSAAQGSQQTQGEAIEEDFERQLKLRYPIDTFEAVPKGIEGADLIQRVRSPLGQTVGTILWEFKNTKAFSQEWVQKLNRDRRSISADISILVTKTLPKDSDPINIMDDVFVVSFGIAIPFVATIRQSIQELSFARNASHGQDEKMKLIYSYITGPSFKQKIMSIVDAYKALKDQTESEKKYFKKMWAAREKMLDHVIESSAGLYGDIEGIAGSVLPSIPQLELPTIETHFLEGDDL
jgi:hypothetical protein